MKQGRLGYNSSNDKYGLLASDLWIDTGFHCGEGPVSYTHLKEERRHAQDG